MSVQTSKIETCGKIIFGQIFVGNLNETFISLSILQFEHRKEFLLKPGLFTTNYQFELGCNYITSMLVTARKRSLGQGNIFSSVCQKFCPQWVFASVHAGMPHPQEQTPPESRHLPGSRSPTP